jgi:hypothetical protein
MKESQNHHYYHPLDTAKGEIRLLILEPATNEEDSIRCNIFHTSLHDRPRYETLSYCWGDETITAPILLHEQPIRVTTNLAFALRHLRNADEARTIWIDALCINQQDDTEKGSQVMIMKEIYQSASRTVLWLGHGKNNPLSPQTLEMLGQTFTTDLREGADEAKARLLSLSEVSLRTFAREFCGILTESDVWNRVWVAQEVTVARDLVLLYGSSELSWWSTTCLFHGIYEMLRISFDEIIGKQFVDNNANISVLVRRFTALRNGSFMPSLFASYLVFGNLKATKPVDHIYALMGLSSDIESLGIRSDYAITAQDLMRKLVRSHIRRYRNLDFLELGSICASHAEWVTSWTPNIHSAVRAFPLAQSAGNHPMYAAGLNSQEASWTSIQDNSDPRKLILVGIGLDTVQEVTSTTSARRMSPEGTREMLLKTLPPNQTSTYSNGQTKFDAYWRTLMFDATSLKRLQQHELDGFRNAFQSILNGSSELFPDQQTQDFWSNKQQIIISFGAGTIPCNFGVTRNGLMAMVPTGTQEDDIVAVLYGGRTPFILRPRLENNGEYHLVGPAYVHGFMDGEAFTWRDAGGLMEREFILV